MVRSPLQRALSVLGTPALVLAAACHVLAGCPNDDDPPKPDKGPEIDSTECKRPPLSECEPPPFGNSCPKLWFCPGCTCSGTMKIAACNPINGDCRWFCTGCYPQEYYICDQTAPPNVLGLCGYCFGDAGPERCDKLSYDIGVGPKDKGGEKAPSDAGPPDAAADGG